MSEQIEGPDAPFTVTLKGGAGFEAPWLVLRGSSAEDVVALLGEAQLNELPKLIGEFAASFRGEAGAAAPSASGGARGGSPSPQRASTPRGRQASSGASAPQSAGVTSTAVHNPPQSNVEYHPEGLVCGAPNCGKEIYLKTGTSKAGNEYQVWTCPDQRQKNDGHFSDYVR